MEIDLKKYNIVRLSAVSPEMKVADVEFNTAKIKEAIEQGLSQGCHFYLFPELCLTGYSCGDLFFQSALESAVNNSLSCLLDFSIEKSVSLVVGAPIRSSGKIYNAAIFISCGKIIGIVPKTSIPNSGEYYEKRWFATDADRTEDSLNILGDEVPFGADLIFQAKGLQSLLVGIEICEDLWAAIPPSSELALEGCNVLLNLSASSEYIGKPERRRRLVASQSERCDAAYLYASAGACESSTDVVMSGHCIIAECGNILQESDRLKFDTQMLIADIDLEKINLSRLKSNCIANQMRYKEFRVVEFEYKSMAVGKLLMDIPKSPFVPIDREQGKAMCDEALNIQATALAKRLKHIQISRVAIGISGGLDSTLALIVCVKAFEKLGLDKSGIIAISMPCFGTSNRTRENARRLATLLGVSFQEIDISQSVESHFDDIGHSREDYGVVYENAQARMRTMVLMDIANQKSAIVIGTGDLSEIALGWATYNGDHISMYSANSGVPKTLIKYMLGCISENISGLGEVLKDIIDTPISPELLPISESGATSQETESIIGPYILHDFFLYYFVKYGLSPSKILLLACQAFKDDFDTEYIKKYLKLFIKRFFVNQYKRSCMPDGVKVVDVALSPRGDWKMPSDATLNLWLEEIDKSEV